MPIVPTGTGYRGTPDPEPDTPLPMGDGMDVTVESGNADAVQLDEKSGALIIPQDDGGVIIDFSPPKPGKEDSEFADNLAEYISDFRLSDISNEIMEGVQADIQSRSDWIETYNMGIDLLGLRIEEPSAGGGDSSAPVEGMSTVRHPLLLEAIVRFQSTARQELLPAEGPVKVKNDGDETVERNDLAEQLQRDMNHYLTITASEYYDDFDRMLLLTGYGGTTYRKVFYDRLRRRPVSEMVSATSLIVSQNATDLLNAQRVTHEILMRPSEVKRHQIAGVYRDVDLGQASGTLDSTTKKIAEVQGMNAEAMLPRDHQHRIWEVCCELDLPEFPHEKDGKETGLPVPYRVTIDVDSREILAIYRNWKEDDEDCRPSKLYVKYSYIPGFGFLDIGLVHLLGNTTMALTAIERMLVDAGMFANFPGFLYAKTFGRQDTNEFRVPPGGGVPIETNGQPLTQNVMPLPYKEPSAVLAQFSSVIATDAQRLGGTAEVVSGEGSMGNVPVGTVMAMIEQATIPQKAVHTRLWRAQSEEFMMLKDLFIEYPEALNQKGASKHQWTSEELADMSIVPAADPNVPSKIHRLMQASAVVQLAEKAPNSFDQVEVLKWVLRTIGLADAEAFLVTPPPQGAPQQPPVDPLKVAELQLKNKIADQSAQKDQADNAVEMQQIQLEATNRAQDRAAKAQEDGMKLETEKLKLAVQEKADTQQHGLASAQATHQQGLAVAQHVLASNTAAHDAEIKRDTLAHTIKEANKPQPKPAAKPAAKTKPKAKDK